MKSNLLASSSSLEGIKKLISDFYYCSIDSIELISIEDEKNKWKIKKVKKIRAGVIVIKKNGRYRFELKEEK